MNRKRNFIDNQFQQKHLFMSQKFDKNFINNKLKVQYYPILSELDYSQNFTPIVSKNKNNLIIPNQFKTISNFHIYKQNYIHINNLNNNFPLNNKYQPIKKIKKVKFNKDVQVFEVESYKELNKLLTSPEDFSIFGEEENNQRMMNCMIQPIVNLKTDFNCNLLNNNNLNKRKADRVCNVEPNENKFMLLKKGGCSSCTCFIF